MKSEKAFGAVLRELRRERGLSQEALALDAGVERNYISLIELGKNSPSLNVLMKLSRALGIRASTMLAKVEDQLGDDDGR